MSRWLCPCWPCSAEPGEVVRALDYAHSSLHDVPGEVFTFERTLEELVLDSNRIRDLPRPLFLCQELRVLSVSDNDVAALPPAVASLCALQRLDASRNALRDVPADIKACKRLASVNLSSNQLVRLPEGLTQLVALQELQLNDVELEFLPASVGRLSLLRVLELRDNRLNSLPTSMSRLKQLARLDVGHNEFRAWPSVLGSLGALVELWADLNELPALPAWVGNLHELQCLDASNNRVSAIAPEIASCVKLVDLRLSYNELSRLPYTLGRLRHLATLKLDHNYLDQLPETIGDAGSLEELVASHNQLDLVTPCLGFLRRLLLLDLDNNNLNEIPPELGSCRALTVLSLRRNRLVSIPPEIGHLPRIRVINLAENRLRNLPVSILNLSSLQALWLSDIQSAPLVQLHREYDVERRCRVLTCLLLPQREDHSDEFGGEASVMPITRRSACIRFSQDLTLEDEPGQLLRAPTPYPKELRTLARQAKQAARQSAARSSARQAKATSDARVPVDADGQPSFVKEQLLSPGVSVNSPVKEARVSRPHDPGTLSRTNSVLQQEHCILREMAVTLGEAGQQEPCYGRGLELQELHSPSREPTYVRNVNSATRIYEARQDVVRENHEDIHSPRASVQPEETYVSRRAVMLNHPITEPSASERGRERESETENHIRDGGDNTSSLDVPSLSAGKESSSNRSDQRLTNNSVRASAPDTYSQVASEDRQRSDDSQNDPPAANFQSSLSFGGNLNTTPISYSSVYREESGRYGIRNEDTSIRRYENLSLIEGRKQLPFTVEPEREEAHDENGNTPALSTSTCDDVDAGSTPSPGDWNGNGEQEAASARLERDNVATENEMQKLASADEVLHDITLSGVSKNNNNRGDSTRISDIKNQNNGNRSLDSGLKNEFGGTKVLNPISSSASNKEKYQSTEADTVHVSNLNYSFKDVNSFQNVMGREELELWSAGNMPEIPAAGKLEKVGTRSCDVSSPLRILDSIYGHKKEVPNNVVPVHSYVTAGRPEQVQVSDRNMRVDSDQMYGYSRSVGENGKHAQLYDTSFRSPNPEDLRRGGHRLETSRCFPLEAVYGQRAPDTNPARRGQDKNMMSGNLSRSEPVYGLQRNMNAPPSELPNGGDLSSHSDGASALPATRAECASEPRARVGVGPDPMYESARGVLIRRESLPPPPPPGLYVHPVKLCHPETQPNIHANDRRRGLDRPQPPQPQPLSDKGIVVRDHPEMLRDTAYGSTIYGNHMGSRNSSGVYASNAEHLRPPPPPPPPQYYPCCGPGNGPSVQYGVCTPVSLIRPNAAPGEPRFPASRNTAITSPEPHPFSRPAGGGVATYPRQVENNYGVGRGIGRPFSEAPPEPVYGYRQVQVQVPPPFTLGALYQQREGLASVHEQNKQIQAMLRRGELPPTPAPAPAPGPAQPPLVVRANVAQCLDDGLPLTAIGPDSQYGQHHVVMRF